MALAPELASRVITNLLDEVDALRAQLTAGGASVGATDSTPAAPRAAPQGPLRRDCALRDALLANHDTFVFDMDGVVYSGAAMIPRANAAIGALMRAGKAVVFVTNNSGKSRREVLVKMEGLGFTGLAIEQILNSGYALALHLRRLSAPGSGSAFRGRKVYSLGGDGVTEELRLAGIDVLHGGSAYSQQCLARLDLTECAAIVPDAAVGAVVTGFNPLCSYHMLTYASMALTSDPSVLFLATNHDKLSPQVGNRPPPLCAPRARARARGLSRHVIYRRLPPHLTHACRAPHLAHASLVARTNDQGNAQGHLLPGGGMNMGALEYVTGRKATVVGKPNQLMLDALFDARPELRRERTLMVGDRIDTDVLFGLGGGLTTLLVLSGCTSEAEMLAWEQPEQRPHFYAPSIAIFCDDEE